MRRCFFQQPLVLGPPSLGQDKRSKARRPLHIRRPKAVVRREMQSQTRNTERFAASHHDEIRITSRSLGFCGHAFGTRSGSRSGEEANRVVLGQLLNGAEVAFTRASSGDWGIEISGSAVPRETQPKPAQIEVYRGDDNVRELAAGYQSLRKEAGSVIARATVEGDGDASFAVEDHWNISGDVVSLSRKVSVTGAEQNAGFSLGNSVHHPADGRVVRCGLSRSRPAVRRSIARW